MKIRYQGWLKAMKATVRRTTSSPALKHVLESQSWITFVFWGVTVIGTIVGLVMHVLYVVDLYQDTPINTDVSQIPSSVEDFPSVTVCQTFRVFSHTKLSKYRNFNLTKFGNRTIADFSSIVNNYLKAIFLDLFQGRYIENLNSILISEYRRIFYALPFNYTQQIPDILVFCEFNGISCDFTHFRKHDHPTHYNCYTFDTETFVKYNPVALKSKSAGLTLVMYTYGYSLYRDQSTKHMAKDSTLELEIHPPGTRPSLLENVINDSNERLIKLNVRKSEYHKLNLNRRPCFQNLIGKKYGYEIIEPLTNFSNPDVYRSSFRERYSKFTRNDCINDEWQRLIWRLCGCFSPLHPLSKYVIEQVELPISVLTWCTDSEMLTEYVKMYRFNTTRSIENGDKYKFYYKTIEGKVGDIGEELKGTRPVYNVECLAKHTNNKDNLERIEQACLYFCFKETYEVETKFLSWMTKDSHRELIKAYLNKKGKDIERKLNQSAPWANHEFEKFFYKYEGSDLTYVNINYDTSSKTLVTEEETYPLINLFSDIGGILGLWVGASILVVAEVIVVCKMMFSACIHDEKEESRAEDVKSVSSKSEIMVAFMSTTSLHGINHLMISENKYKRFLWVLVVFGCLAGLIVNIENVVSRFQSKPISIEMNYNLDVKEYPSITFCPSTIFSNYLTRMSLTRQSRSSFYNLLNDGIEPLWTHLYEWRRNVTTVSGQSQSFSDSHIQYMKEASVRNTIMQYLLDFRKLIISRQNAYDLIFACEFTYQKCSFLNFKLILHPVYKFCFTFQVSEKNNRLGYPEYLSLLVLTNDVDISLFSNSSSISLFRGGLYQLNPFMTMPTMNHAHPFTLATRQIVSITKTEDQIMNSDLYPCRETNDELITLMGQHSGFEGVSQESKFRYSSELCQQLKIQDAVYQHCNCVSPMLPLTKDQNTLYRQPYKCAQLPLQIFDQEFKISRSGNVSFVTLTRGNRLLKLSDFVAAFQGGSEFLKNFKCHSRIMSNTKLKYEAISECPVPCKRIDYSITINQNSVPYDYDESTMETLLNEHRAYCKKVGAPRTIPDYFVEKDITEGYRLFQYFSGFHIYFQTSEVRSVLQSEGYTLVNVLSDLGGVLGLWFGISVATFMEFLELVTRLLLPKN